MKKTKIITIIIFLVIIAICIILLFFPDIFNFTMKGDNTVVTEEPSYTTAPSSNNSDDTDDDDDIDDDTDDDDDGTDVITTPDPNSTELNLYTIDYDTMECIPNTVVVDESFKVDASNIVNKVIEDFLESPVIIKIEENEDNVIIYFDSDKAPLVNVSKDIELAMLDSIAYSLIDNLTYCQSVYFRTDKGDYISDNLQLEYDEPYLSSELDE